MEQLETMKKFKKTNFLNKNHPSWIILTVVLYLMFSHLKGVQMRKDRKIVERVTMLALAGWGAMGGI